MLDPRQLCGFQTLRSIHNSAKGKITMCHRGHVRYDCIRIASVLKRRSLTVTMAVLI